MNNIIKANIKDMAKRLTENQLNPKIVIAVEMDDEGYGTEMWTMFGGCSTRQEAIELLECSLENLRQINQKLQVSDAFQELVRRRGHAE